MSLQIPSTVFGRGKHPSALEYMNGFMVEEASGPQQGPMILAKQIPWNFRKLLA